MQLDTPLRTSARMRVQYCSVSTARLSDTLPSQTSPALLGHHQHHPTHVAFVVSARVAVPAELLLRWLPSPRRPDQLLCPTRCSD